MTSTTEAQADLIEPAVHTRRKKAVTVETLIWDGTNADQLDAFTGGKFQPVDPEDRDEDPDITGSVLDGLHSTWIGVKTGQHVIKGVKGEFYPIDAEVLAETYDEAEPIADAADLVRAFRAYAAGVGWEIETNHRDNDDDTHSYDLYVWPAKAGA